MSDNITFKRILKWGFINFFRNGVISVATVLVMSLSIFMIGSILVGSAFLSGVITNLEEKVDISVYFNQASTESDILQFQKDLQNLPNIKNVAYVSSTEALASFQELHKNDQVTLQALQIVNSNPFPPSLEIRAKDPSNYDSITKYIEQSSSAKMIDIDPSTGQQKITYRQNQIVIDKLSGILHQVRVFGLGISIALALIAILVAYNTMRLAIYNSKDEISVMQLVGASRSFIRGPFLIEGVMHGIIATIVTMAFLYPIMWWVGKKTSLIFGNISIFDYFKSNIFELVAILFVSGILLGVLSAGIAMRKYLKV